MYTCSYFWHNNRVNVSVIVQSKKKKKVSLTAERVTTYDFAASDDFIWKCTNYYFSGFGHCNRPTFSKELGPNGVRSASFSFYFIVKSPFWLVNSVGLSNYDLKSTDMVIILSFCDGYDISSYNFQLPSKKPLWSLM